MTEIMPFPENNYETVLLDRPFGCPSFYFQGKGGKGKGEAARSKKRARPLYNIHYIFPG